MFHPSWNHSKNSLSIYRYTLKHGRFVPCPHNWWLTFSLSSLWLQSIINYEAKRDGRVSQASAAVNFGLSWFFEPCDITLLWIPGHKGIALNVIADDNARCARQLPEGKFAVWRFRLLNAFLIQLDINKTSCWKFTSYWLIRLQMKEQFYRDPFKIEPLVGVDGKLLISLNAAMEVRLHVIVMLIKRSL